MCGRYNGTIERGYSEADGKNEAHVAAIVSRMYASLYQHLVGTEIQQQEMPYPSPSFTFNWDFTIAASFIFGATLGFMQIIITFQIVTEKVTNMRELMAMAGLSRLPYWAITWLYSFCLYFVQIVFFFIFCYVADLTAITNHDFGMLVVLFFLFITAQISYACWLSTLFSHKWAALIVNFFLLVFVFWFLGWILAERAVGYGTGSSAFVFFCNLLPIFAISHAAEVLTHAGLGNFFQRGGRSLGFDNIGPDSPTPVSMIMLSMLTATFLWMALALYFDTVLKIGPGIKRPWNFLCDKAFWADSVRSKAQATADLRSMAKGPEPSEAPEVSAERERVLEQQGGVQVVGLAKVYPGASRPAVVNVQFGIHPSECFGLLGSNGAGKSTTIHIMCGLHPPSEGSVFVTDGAEMLDVRRDLTRIQSSMGVCSQDNLLWDDLTGPEHLRFFARLRRVSKRDTKDHVDFWLRRVNLASRGDRYKRSKAYSGGMKRRLNTANAFIGNPRLVYLDEPSTGLDPESRQQLWRAVLAAKPGKSIILTTHALEEAEALCDRVGIMTFGLMRTLGTPTELRMRFDQGYKFLMACEYGDVAVEDNAHNYVVQLMPQARQVDRINGVLTYIVPKGSVTMSAVFKGMEANKEAYKIKDWGLSHTSLEEVFLQIVAANSSASR